MLGLDCLLLPVSGISFSFWRHLPNHDLHGRQCWLHVASRMGSACYPSLSGTGDFSRGLTLSLLMLSHLSLYLFSSHISQLFSALTLTSHIHTHSSHHLTISYIHIHAAGEKKEKEWRRKKGKKGGRGRGQGREEKGKRENGTGRDSCMPAPAACNFLPSPPPAAWHFGVSGISSLLKTLALAGKRRRTSSAAMLLFRSVCCIISPIQVKRSEV